MSMMRCDECERYVDTDDEEVQWLKTGCICERCWDGDEAPEFNDA